MNDLMIGLGYCIMMLKSLFLYLHLFSIAAFSLGREIDTFAVRER